MKLHRSRTAEYGSFVISVIYQECTPEYALISGTNLTRVSPRISVKENENKIAEP